MLSFKEYVIKNTKILNEVVDIGRSINDYIPLKDNYNIVVYHGVNNERDLYGFLTYGTTGKMYAGRRYSYEADNNPRGLFVTINLNVAKEFARKYIIEFHTRVSDLESPVWPSGGFSVQGQKSEQWKDLDERERYRNELRSEYKNSKYDFIKKSDRPELAQSLYLNAENQALFIGDLNSNSIKAIWVSRNPSRISLYDRYERKDFLHKFGDQLSKEGYETDANKRAENSVLKPRDEVTLQNILNGMKRHYGDSPLFNTNEKLLSLLKDVKDKDLLHSILWPHQVDKAWDIIKSL